MATVNRVHGSDDQVGVIYKPNCNLYSIYVNDGEGNIDLYNVDTYGEDSQVDGVLELLLKEINPLAWFAEVEGNKLCVVMDKSINDASELQARIRNIPGLGGTWVYPALSMSFGDDS